MTGCSPDAERAHSVLSQALTAQVFREGSSGPVDQRMDTVRLCPPLPDPLPATELSLNGITPCVLEVADAAPVAVRERIRARVQLIGRELASESGTCRALHISVDEVVLVVGPRSIPMSLSQVLAAPLDPLAAGEASILTHLATRHDDVLRGLLSLLPHSDLQAAVAVRPLRLDRRGIELRIEYVRGHRDHRLEFERPVTARDELGAAMTLLIARARTAARRPCSRASAWPGSNPPRSPVEAIIRAADAARRLCDPS